MGLPAFGCDSDDHVTGSTATGHAVQKTHLCYQAVKGGFQNHRQCLPLYPRRPLKLHFRIETLQ